MPQVDFAPGRDWATMGALAGVAALGALASMASLTRWGAARHLADFRLQQGNDGLNHVRGRGGARGARARLQRAARPCASGGVCATRVVRPACTRARPGCLNAASGARAGGGPAASR